MSLQCVRLLIVFASAALLVFFDVSGSMLALLYALHSLFLRFCLRAVQHYVHFRFFSEGMLIVRAVQYIYLCVYTDMHTAHKYVDLAQNVFLYLRHIDFMYLDIHDHTSLYCMFFFLSFLSRVVLAAQCIDMPVRCKVRPCDYMGLNMCVLCIWRA